MVHTFQRPKEPAAVAARLASRWRCNAAHIPSSTCLRLLICFQSMFIALGVSAEAPWHPASKREIGGNQSKQQGGRPSELQLGVSTNVMGCLFDSFVRHVIWFLIEPDVSTYWYHAAFKVEYQPLHRSNSQSCLLYRSPSPRDQRGSRMPSSA